MGIPFKYGCIVTGKNFCGRPDLLKTLSEYMKSGQNVVLFGERRIGKSSAVAQSVLNTRGYSTLDIGLWGVKSVNDLLQRIVKAILAKEKRKTIGRLFSKLAKLGGTISADPITGMPAFSFDASIKVNASSIGEAFDIIKELYGKKKVVVAMDEFQDVLDLGEDQSNEAFGIMRDKIQKHANIPYFFLGSIRSAMAKIFTLPDSAFFNQAIPIEVLPLERDLYAKFIRRKMQGGGRVIDKTAFKMIFDVANDITGDVQKICEAIWFVTGPTRKVITDEVINKALELIFTREGAIYQDYIKVITRNQLLCLMAISKKGGINLTAGEYVAGTGIKNPSSMLMAANSLVSKGILFKKSIDQGKGIEYRFVNPFFKEWLLRESF